MAFSSINEQQQINQQINTQENCYKELQKAKSLLDVALGGDLLNYSPTTVYHYLWVISDILDATVEISEALLDSLFDKQKTG